jgi:hypothetical protein
MNFRYFKYPIKNPNNDPIKSKVMDKAIKLKREKEND